jgi:hypothetical protein
MAAAPRLCLGLPVMVAAGSCAAVTLCVLRSRGSGRDSLLALLHASQRPAIAEMNRTRLVLVAMNNRIIPPYLAATDADLIQSNAPPASQGPAAHGVALLAVGRASVRRRGAARLRGALLRQHLPHHRAPRRAAAQETHHATSASRVPHRLLGAAPGAHQHVRQIGSELPVLHVKQDGRVLLPAQRREVPLAPHQGLAEQADSPGDGWMCVLRTGRMVPLGVDTASWRSGQLRGGSWRTRSEHV